MHFDLSTINRAKYRVQMAGHNQHMTRIEIQNWNELPQGRFEVTGRDNTVKKHNVMLTQEYYEDLTVGAVPAEELVNASFEFLLAREPNTSILSEFDLRVISKYLLLSNRK